MIHRIILQWWMIHFNGTVVSIHHMLLWFLIVFSGIEMITASSQSCNNCTNGFLMVLYELLQSFDHWRNNSSRFKSETFGWTNFFERHFTPCGWDTCREAQIDLHLILIITIHSIILQWWITQVNGNKCISNPEVVHRTIPWYWL